MSQLTQLATRIQPHAHRLANTPNAGHHYQQLQNLITDIEHTINRPQPPRECGPCPTPTETSRCGTRLTAPHNTPEITCPACGTTHNTEQLIAQTFNEAQDFHMAPHELFMALDKMGIPLPRATFYKWRKNGRITPDSHTTDGKARYTLRSIKNLMTQRSKTTPAP